MGVFMLQSPLMKKYLLILSICWSGFFSSINFVFAHQVPLTYVKVNCDDHALKPGNTQKFKLFIGKKNLRSDTNEALIYGFINNQLTIVQNFPVTVKSHQVALDDSNSLFATEYIFSSIKPSFRFTIRTYKYHIDYTFAQLSAVDLQGKKLPQQLRCYIDYDEIKIL